jgi:CRP/FNR family cyclic AMP-dependent transcriptional regulator
MATPSSTLRDFLGRTPFFGGLDEAALDRVIDMLRERTVSADDTVFREGDKGGSMYVVHDGELVATQGVGGGTVRLRHFGPGDFFGEMTLIEMQPRPATVRAERAAHLYELTGADLYRLYREDVKSYILVLQNINRELCRRLRGADNRLAQLANEAGDEATQIGSVRRTAG